MRVIVTGASGILGTAVYDAFKGAGYEVLGLAHSRPKGDLVKLNLLDNTAVETAFGDFKPDWVIHCAAERRPDVAEKDPAGAEKLNKGVPAHLAQLAKTVKYKLVYISTDYVFDGTSPPYTPASTPNPLNLYGRTKREGEVAVLDAIGADVTVLRVPVLYGPAPNNADTAVNILIDVVQDQSGKTYKMDHFATRFPTNVVDIAAFLVKLTTLKKPLLPILHYSASEPFTKYEMCLIFSKILNLPHDHIVADAEPPKDATTRPKNCQLDTTETEVFLGEPLDCSLFEEWWTEYLKRD